MPLKNLSIFIYVYDIVSSPFYYLYLKVPEFGTSIILFTDFADSGHFMLFFFLLLLICVQAKELVKIVQII